MELITTPQIARIFPPSHPSAAAKQPLKRQVFISHTGKDEGAKNFAASILKPALEAAGLAVYMDFSNLQLGNSFISRFQMQRHNDEMRLQLR